MNQSKSSIQGVFTPVVTPFNRDSSVNDSLFIQHCQWLLSEGAGLAYFGTNSEANSLSLKERRRLMDLLVDNDLPPARMMPGTGCCSLEETVELTAAAVDYGCMGVLMLPPFFYKNVPDEGLFRYYADVIEKIGNDKLKIYLYHIPQVSGVPINKKLIDLLLAEFPQTIAGVKDSSGNWQNTEMLLKEYPQLNIFPASEALLDKALPLGAAGCISATANIQPGAIHALIQSYGTESFEKINKQASAVRKVVQEFPMIPALKYLVAKYTQQALWQQVRAPLVALSEADASALDARLAELEFTMNIT